MDDSLLLLGVTIGLGFAAGLNLYAVVLVLGLGAHLGLVHLPISLEGLAPLGHPSVVLLAGACYAAQFLADKVRWLDSGWDVVHGVIRPLGAVAVALAVVGPIGSATEIAAVALAGVIAAATHAAKSGVRLVANSVPEPLSNIALSLVEDALAIGGTWLAVHHPAVAGPAVALAVAGLLARAPSLARVAAVQAWAVIGLLRGALGGAPRDQRVDLPVSHAPLLAAGSPIDFAIRCAAGGGFGMRRHDMGFLCLAGGELLFVTRQGHRLRGFPIDLAELEEIRLRPGPALDRLTLRSGVAHAHFLVFKDAGPALEWAVRRLGRARAEMRARTPVELRPASVRFARRVRRHVA
jgi:hypothetical protein